MRAARRFLHAGAALALFAAASAPRAARAERTSEVLQPTRPDPSRYETPQNFALELRVGLYKPDVDGDPALGGRTPYATSFGDKRRAMLGFEVDWQALRIKNVLSLGPGLGFASTTATRPAYTQSGVPSSEEMSFTVQPFYGLAVLRIDALSRGLGIPLQPFAKVGASYALWRASTSAGTSEFTRADGSVVKGRGGTWGMHGAVGVALDLAALDPGSARRLDQATGINHTYLFGEWAVAKLDGAFGQSKAMHVGDSTWNAGMAFEF